MNVGGGGGVHRPLGPQAQPQQPQVKQPAVGNNQQPPQGKPGRAGRTLHNINSFNSQPVSNDLQQLQQWLNKLKGGAATAKPKPPPSQPLQQGNQQIVSPRQMDAAPEPASDLQMAQINGKQTAVIPEPDIDPTSTAPSDTMENPEPPPLSADQKAVLKDGLDNLGSTLELGKADIARLAHAQATENDASYFYQLGKLDIPPGGAREQQLKTGLTGLFAQVGGAGSTIAEEIKPTIVLDNVSRLASSRAINLPESLVVDLGALTHNEAERFIALAEVTGVPPKKAETLLRGFEALGQQFDLSTPELDSLLGDASRTVNTELSVEMDKAAQSLNLPPPLFNDLANAALAKNSQAFAAIGTQGGLRKEQLRDVLPKITSALTEIVKSPVITIEKLQRFTKDTAIQSQIYAAGKEFGLTPPQSLKLTAVFVDDDLSGYVNLAEDYGLGRNASKLLNKLADIADTQGQQALILATNNFPEIVEQRVLAKELGLQGKPVEWATTKPAPYKPPSRGPFDFLNKVGGMTPPQETAQADAGARAEAATKARNEVRFVRLFDELRHVQGEINKLDKAMRNPFFLVANPQANGKMQSLQQDERDIRVELGKIQQAGHAPSAQRAQEIKLLDELGNLKDELRNVEGMMKGSRFTAVFHQPAAKALKAQILSIEKQLDTLRG